MKFFGLLSLSASFASALVLRGGESVSDIPAELLERTKVAEGVYKAKLAKTDSVRKQVH